MGKKALQVPKNIWVVSREYEGIAGAGGVKDVCRQLAESLVRYGKGRVSVVLPRYGFIDPSALGYRVAAIGHMPSFIAGKHFTHSFQLDMHYVEEERRESVAIWQGELHGVHLFLVEAERFADKRSVYTYTEEDELEKDWQRQGQGHFDYFAMNVLLQKAALDLMLQLGEHPDVVHCHDGHAALLPAMMKENSGYRAYFAETGSVVTIHNAGMGYHQEVEDLDFAHAITGLPWSVIQNSILGNGFDPFMAAADYAVINTVSENYAIELQQSMEDGRTGWLGHALSARGIKLAGITNGINPDDFDPTHPQDLHLSHGFNVRKQEMAGKIECKKTLLGQVNSVRIWDSVRQNGALTGSLDLPLFTFIGRLTTQKGVDVLLEAILQLFRQGAPLHMLLLGSGSAEFERQVELLVNSPEGWGKICFLKGFDPALANQVYAAGDFFLVPSRYEPCGLTDYIAQLLGNLPIVHRVGGLIKVLDGVTGFSYTGNSPGALAEAMWRALEMYQSGKKVLREMQLAAVTQIDKEHTWEKVMKDYVQLYRQAESMWEIVR
mgnify:CR=1 FL=1